MFCKGLIPKVVKQPIKLKAVLETDGLPSAIKTLYHQYRNDIQKGFSKFAEQNKRKPKHQGDRAPILKHIINRDPSIEIKSGRTLNQYLEEVAKKEKPSEMALLLVQDLLKVSCNFKLGTKGIKKIISDNSV